MKMEQTQCSEMSAVKHLTPENNSKDYTQRTYFNFGNAVDKVNQQYTTLQHIAYSASNCFVQIILKNRSEGNRM
jgi:Ulp1 family protease